MVQSHQVNCYWGGGELLCPWAETWGRGKREAGRAQCRPSLMGMVKRREASTQYQLSLPCALTNVPPSAHGFTVLQCSRWLHLKCPSFTFHLIAFSDFLSLRFLPFIFAYGCPLSAWLAAPPPQNTAQQQQTTAARSAGDCPHPVELGQGLEERGSTDKRVLFRLGKWANGWASVGQRGPAFRLGAGRLRWGTVQAQ